MNQSTTQASNWGSVEPLGARHISTLPRYWLTRLYVALATLCKLGLIWFEPTSLVHRLISQSGSAGWWLIAGMAVAACVCVIDVLANDILPSRYALRCTKRFRHIFYIAIAIGLTCISYVFIAAQGGWFRPLVLPYLMDAIMAALVAFLDLFQRHRAARK